MGQEHEFGRMGAHDANLPAEQYGRWIRGSRAWAGTLALARWRRKRLLRGTAGEIDLERGAYGCW